MTGFSSAEIASNANAVSAAADQHSGSSRAADAGDARTAAPFGSATLIVNASAGTGCSDAWANALIEKFHSHGMTVQLTLARSGVEILSTAKQAVADGARLVIAGGGDGTQSAVASVLAGTDAVQGVLALGTLNHFARDLRIPIELDGAIQTIAAGVVTRVDVGEVNGRIFINNSGLGIYPDLVRDRQRQQRRLGRGKWLAFALATLAIARRFPFLDLRLHIDGEERKRRTPFVFVGNNQYQMEGFNIGVRERLDGGCLCLYMAHRTGRIGLLRLALHALTHRLAQARDFDMLNSDELFITTHKKRLRVATDGEVTRMSTPLHYRIRRAALKVIVPPGMG